MKLFRVRTLRKGHRYLGLLVGIQLFFWTVSGLYFAWNPLSKVRGEHLANPSETLAAVGDLAAVISPQEAIAALEVESPEQLELDGLALMPLLGEPYYELRYREAGTERTALIHAHTGVHRGELTPEEARAVAEADFAAAAPIRAIERVESSVKDGEYRGKPLPAWRVTFDHATNTRIYIDAIAGRITARRNDTWRIFDFLWMFHILDFEARDDFNHWLLRIMSLLGVVTVLSGFALFVVTSKPMVERRGRRARDSLG
ncbi:MAG: PepSY domain-containing protein [Thermoanaerobaculia bacterium]|nr:PepSY domain-containing protein [Thermoanaerobaculia bacterium]